MVIDGSRNLTADCGNIMVYRREIKSKTMRYREQEMSGALKFRTFMRFAHRQTDLECVSS